MPAVVFALALAAAPQAPGLETALRREIHDLERTTSARPRDAAAWSRLAVAWRRLARTTGDAACDERAWEAIHRALAADPGDSEALGLKAWIQAARHDFEGAVVTARGAIAASPDDSWSHGVLADALTELGRYPEAVAAVEEMMRRKPGLGAYSRAAHLRALHGDREGAIALMEMAVEAASPSDPESLAWARVMLGREHQARGDHARARDQYRRALEAVPDYHLALFHLGESQAAAGEIDAAIATLERLHARHRTATLAAALGDLHAASGREERARALYRQVDEIADRRDPSQAEPRWLARFYADQRRRLGDALRLVEAELATHQDVETWDGYAWALHRAGRNEEALAASEKALALGTRDARLLYHRGMIELALGRTESGRARIREALALGNLGPLERREAEAALVSGR